MDTFKNNILTALSLFFHSAIFGKLVALVRAVAWSSGDWLGFDPYSALCPLGSPCKIRSWLRGPLWAVSYQRGPPLQNAMSCGLRKQEFICFLTVLEAGCLRWVPAWLGAAQSYLFGVQMAAFPRWPHMAEKKSDSSLRGEFLFLFFFFFNSTFLFPT